MITAYALFNLVIYGYSMVANMGESDRTSRIAFFVGMILTTWSLWIVLHNWGLA